MLLLGASTVLLYLTSAFIELQMSRNNISSTHLSVAAGLMLLYVISTVLLFWIYAAVLSMAREGWLNHKRALQCSFAVPVIVNLILLARLPLQSQDVLSYLAHGFLGEFPGHNPIVATTDDALDTPLGSRLLEYGWHTVPNPSPYGILWTHVEVAIAQFWGTSIWGAVLSFKALSLSASLVTAYLIWFVVGRTRPQLQIWATLAYLWNPLVLVEFAGEGHNDSVMIALSIAAVAAALTGRAGTSVTLLLLGAMAKYICVLFAPAQLTYVWRHRQGAARLALLLATALAASVTIAVTLYWPYWVGPQSFVGIMNRTQAGNAYSLFGIVRSALAHTPIKPISGPVASIFVSLPLVVLVTYSGARVKTPNDLARACTWASLGFVLMTAPDYWPWYACLPIAWICIGELERLFWLLVLLSLTGRLVGPLEELRVHGYLDWHFARGMNEALGVLLPSMALAAWILRARACRRTSAEPDT